MPTETANSTETGAMRIAVYAIALNEEHHVDRFLSGAVGADVIVVADTGSTDGTVKRLRAGGAIVHEIAVRPWRFDVARNTALALVPSDIDVCISLDMDEVLAPGWRAHVESGWGDATYARYRFVWTHMPDGSDGVTFWQDKIHCRHGYRWVHPCHEGIRADRITEKVAWLDLEVHHWPDPDKSRGQYLELLEQARRETPHEPRMAHLLGREYIHSKQWVDAEAELKRHIELPNAGDSDQRAESMRMLSDVCSTLGRLDEALDWSRQAVEESSGKRREPLVALAEALHKRGDWEECLTVALSALAITDGEGMTRSVWAWGARPHYLASVAANRLGELDGALAHAESAAALAPNEPRYVALVAQLRELNAQPG